MTLASPVKVPAAATQLQIRLRVLDRAGQSLPGESFDISMENGFLRTFRQLDDVNSDNDGLLLVTVDISSSFGESAAHVWAGVYGDNPESLPAQFIGHFTTLQNMDIVPVPVVIPADIVLTESELASIRDLDTAAYVDLNSDTLSDLLTVDAERRLVGAVSSALDAAARADTVPFAAPVPAAARASLRLMNPEYLQHLRDGARDGKTWISTLTPRDAGKITRLAASGGQRHWNGARCGLALEAGAATVPGGGVGGLLGGGPAVVCTGFAVSIDTDSANGLLKDLHNCDMISNEAYATELFATSVATMGTGVSASPEISDTEIALGLAEFAVDGEDRSDCQWFAGQSNGFTGQSTRSEFRVNDGYFDPSNSGFGTSFVLELQSRDGDLEGTLTTRVSGATVESINLPAFAGFGVLPVNSIWPGNPLLAEGNHNLACALEFWASGGDWRAADWTDIRDYLNKGGHYVVLSEFLRNKALLSTLSGRLCREEPKDSGDVFDDRLSVSGGWLGPRMMVVSAGTFTMGDASDTTAQPTREVTFEHDFAIGVHEITQADYGRFARATGRALLDDSDWGRGARPAISVSWDDAVAYAEWLSAVTGKTYRLPTEAEWEYAARAGTETTYSWGNAFQQGNANCNGCGSDWDNRQTAPVGQFGANPWGLRDMHGNVREWVQDCWNSNYSGAPADGSTRLSDGCTDRVQRGGSWSDSTGELGSAKRDSASSGQATTNVGFRLVQELTTFYGGAAAATGGIRTVPGGQVSSSAPVPVSIQSSGSERSPGPGLPTQPYVTDFELINFVEALKTGEFGKDI